MLRTIRKYRRSVLGLVGIGLIAIAMSGFGVDLINPRQNEPFAIKINDQVVSFDELNTERRNVEERYRQMFGPNYRQMLKTFNVNLNQEIVDKKIADALLEQAARELGLYVSDKAVINALQSELFPQGYDPQEYSLFLERIGLSAAQFEEALRKHNLRLQFTSLLNDGSLVSKRESLSALKQQKTRYSADYTEFSPESYLSSVPAPSDAEIDSWYNEHSAEYQEPARVAYEYAVLDPADYLQQVQINPEDVEDYYDVRRVEYMTPEELRLRYIRVSVPKDAADAQKAELKKKAEDALAKIKNGEPFAEVARLYSDDTGSAMGGGEMGWVEKGRISKELESAAAKLLEGETSGVIESAAAFEIIQVAERKPSRQKELEEVRPQIEAAIRKSESPAYTANLAADLYDNWSKGSASLSEFAAANKLKVAVTAAALTKEADPDPALKGLSAQVLDAPEQEQQLVEIQDKSVLVLVKEFKPASTAPLAGVREKIISTLKERAAREKARAAAQSMLEDLRSGSGTLREIAEKKQLKVQTAADLTPVSPGAIFDAPELGAALFRTSRPLEKPEQVYENGGKFYIFQATAITAPASQELEGLLDKTRTQENRKTSEALLSSVVEKLKARAKIDVDPAVLAREG